MALEPPLNVAANDLSAVPVSGLSVAAADVSVGLAARSSGAAQPLSSIALQSDTSVQHRIASRDSWMRSIVAVAIVATFVVANGAILWGVWLVFEAEMAAIQAKFYVASDRIVTAGLLMTLVGATTVQLGALTILMGKYLFPPSK